MVEFLRFYGACLAIEVPRRCAARLRIRRKPCCQGRARRPKCESEEILDDVPNLTQHISSMFFGIEIVILLNIEQFIEHIIIHFHLIQSYTLISCVSIYIYTYVCMYRYLFRVYWILTSK